MRIWTVSIALLISTQLMAQEIPAVKFDGIEDLISEKSDKVKVINFWATWCKPCIQELPEFEKLNSDNQDVEVYLVSMDFVEDMEKVERFVAARKLKSKVILLDDISYDSFMSKIDKSWSGSIPATLIVDGRSGKKAFYEKQFLEGELSTVLNNFMN
ncbi:MAG: TlpA family protein disulfide reductase [bacterium]|nr:TlpA family protein disulfide reductase [bacterium]